MPGHGCQRKLHTIALADANVKILMFASSENNTHIQCPGLMWVKQKNKVKHIFSNLLPECSHTKLLEMHQA